MRLAVLAVLILAGCTEHPASASFAWEGTPGDAWVRIRNLNGAVEVRRSPDERAIVAAAVRTGGRRVTWVRDSSDEAITLCVAFADTDGRDCDRLRGAARGGPLPWLRRLLAGGGRGGASVKYVVYVPPTARIDLRTVNGGIDVESVARDVRVRTVNGKVSAVVAASGVDVETVNGSIDARLELHGDGDVRLATVNGSVTAELPASVDGDVQLSTVNGSATSDFALEGSRKSRRGMLGEGGRDIQLKAVNGSVTLRRRG